jgi:hypothetical protein
MSNCIEVKLENNTKEAIFTRPVTPLSSLEGVHNFKNIISAWIQQATRMKLYLAWRPTHLKP